MVMLIASVGLILVWLMPRTALDAGMKRSITAVSTGIVVVLLLAWFVLFSGARRTTRMLMALIAVAIVGGAVASVRRIDFSGDMKPNFDWRWTTDRNVAVERHRAATAGKQRVVLGDISLGPDDVLEYRGANRDGIVQGPALARDWSQKQPVQVWRQPVGGGYAAFVVAGPLAITIEQRRDREAVVAYDAASGAQLWLHEYPALFSEALGGAGPRATPTIAGNRVYALGATGILTCLDLTTGKSHWSTNILEINHCGNLDWGMAGSPLVDNGLVFVNPGTQGGNKKSRAVLALDAESGELRFGGGSGQAGYASPMLATLAGLRQLLMFEGTALVAYAVDTGEVLWRSEWKSDFDINAVQPIVLPDDQIFITSNTGCSLLKITRHDEGLTASTQWKNRNLKGQYDCPISYQGYVYGLDDGILVCLDLRDGKRRWKGGRFGNGQMLLTGDLLVILGEQGELALVQATPHMFTELGRIQAIEGRTWNNPTLRSGRLFIRNHLEMAAFDLPLEPHSDP
jgi:outer membrane protein assembly factor BamB